MISKCGRMALNTRRPNCAPVSTRIPTAQWVATILPIKVHNAIGRGALPRDYSRIRVPILALFGTLSINYRYQPKDAQERAAIEEFDAATAVYGKRNKKNLLKAKGGMRIVDLPQADHYLFLSNEADVLREMRAFIAGLK
jgi:pimeloyl-ACP methyl ester carboxylesterase